MKTGFFGLNITEGKEKYNDPRLNALAGKFEPKKTTFFYMEFAKDESVQCDAIAVKKSSLLDLLILDIEKCETRIKNSTDAGETGLMKKALSKLEEETPLCDLPFSEDEKAKLRAAGIVSLKPVIIVEEENPAADALIERILEKAGVLFFYTAGKTEVRSWPVPAGSDIVTCAGKIHTDLARGFIKADIVKFEDMMRAHNMNDARTQGFVRVVDRDYIIQPGEVIEIRYNV